MVYRHACGQFITSIEGMTIIPQTTGGWIDVPECNLQVLKYLAYDTTVGQPLYFGRPTPMPRF